ncbi:MAG TPA: DUF6448 family protein [Thermoanaerobaculia bacterium]|nr:DUF6448 family protein [Thermoanaerobaculia bacterium]
MKMLVHVSVLALVFVLIVVLSPRVALAHCDTADGPVVADAKAALEKGDVTPVLKWVRPEAEAEIKAAFARALAVRGKGPEARALAEQYFFENLVRVHRAGEGAPYTGILPAGTPVDPAVALADEALLSGNADKLLKGIAHHVDEGVRERFTRAAAAKKRSETSVAAGREFVEAYVEFTHYVERLHLDATTPAAHGPGAPAAEHKH